MKNKRFTFTLKDSLRRKLTRDTMFLEFPSISAYLNELIEKGLPASKSLDSRLQEVEKKLETLSDSLLNELKDLHKRVYITYRIVSYSLARSYFIKPGSISENDMEDANAFIESEVKNMEKKFGGE